MSFYSFSVFLTWCTKFDYVRAVLMSCCLMRLLSDSITTTTHVLSVYIILYGASTFCICIISGIQKSTDGARAIITGSSAALLFPYLSTFANAATILTVVAAVLFGGREAKIRTLLSFLRADRMGTLQNIRPGLQSAYSMTAGLTVPCLPVFPGCHPRLEVLKTRLAGYVIMIITVLL